MRIRRVVKTTGPGSLSTFRLQAGNSQTGTKLHDSSRSWVRSGVGAYAGAARPPFYGTPSAFVWPSPRQMPDPPCPYFSEKPPTSATTKHADGPQHGPTPRIPTRQHPMSGGPRRESRHVPVKAYSWRFRTMLVACRSQASLSTRSLDTWFYDW